MASALYDILLIGDYFYDLIYSGLPEFPTLGREIYSTNIQSTGGAMFITAAALRRLGAHVGWAGTFGTDEYSRFVRELALDEDIDLALTRTLDHPYRQITTAMPFSGERAFVTFADPEPPDRYTYWLHIIESASYKHLHLGGLMPTDKIAPLLATARARGATISMDCQDAPALISACDWSCLLESIDIFMPNAREARMVTGQTDLYGALNQLMEWVELIVIKDGARGAWVGRRGEIVHSPAVCAGNVVDTTGAGDCFNAGFLYGWIVEQQPLDVCGRYGNICGGMSVTGVGGATHAPTHPQLDEWMAKVED
ncbi:MAG: carbohydrate kinase family protein [Chloroflexota bacterium]|nr:carbohydrate kinase family protein [Chloroflexota bacterium]